MKRSNVIVTILILLISGLIIFYSSSYNRRVPEGFAPIDAVYHGSSNTDIKVFEPRDNHIRDKDEGPVVFATLL